MNKTLRKSILSVFLVVSLMLGMLTSAFATTYTSTVDFAKKDTNNPYKHNLVGFLGQFGSSINDTAIAPLHPAVLRINPTDATGYARAVALGAKVIMVLSDGYGYPLNSWNGNGAPYNGNAAWETYVHAQAVAHASHTANILAWQVWNESDIAGWNTTTFWDGTQAQFYDVFARAVTQLRTDLGPKTVIAGPTLANYDNTAITQFLTYVNTNHIRVDMLDYHELSGTDADPSVIATHISTLKSTVASTYPKVGIKKYMLSETVGPALHMSPGGILNNLYWIENAGVDYAVKSCWNDTAATNNCFNNSLDGIVQKTTGSAPRAPWWPYRYYAKLLKTRVSATTSNNAMAVIASKSPTEIIFGYAADSPATVDVTLTIKNPANAGLRRSTLTARIYKVANSGEATVTAPTLVSTNTVTITNGTGSLTISAIASHELYIVKLTP